MRVIAIELSQVKSQIAVRVFAHGDLGLSSEKKGIWWMPWHQEAMKDVAPCDKLRGEGSAL
jgi:hypothetical protein